MTKTCCSPKEQALPIEEQISCCASNQKTRTEHEQHETTTCCDSHSVVTDANDSCCSSMVTNVDSCCDAEDITTNSPPSSCCSVVPEEELDEHSDFSNDTTAHNIREEFRVYGMDCPACAVTIEKSLRNNNMITAVDVNYSSGKMSIQATEKTNFEAIEQQMKKIGFDVEPVNINTNMKNYFIEGMDCSSCAATIENHLNTLPSVKQVRVNFSTGKMNIEHNNDPEEIMKEVEKVGFTASLITSAKQLPHERSKNKSGGIIFSGILIALGFIGSYTATPTSITTILFAIAMVISGHKPVKSAYYAIRSRSLDMNVLMSAAAIGAAFLGEWFEGATVVWLFSLGLNLQNRAVEKTRGSIRSLMELAPPEAWVKVGNELVKKAVEDVAVHDVIVVKPGDRIPLDGEVIEGESTVNQSAITGESIPVDKTQGSFVYAGSINEHGSLSIHVTKLIADTTISKIIHAVEEAQENKAPTEAFIDKFARIYTPIVFILALLVIVLPPVIGVGTWEEWIYKGLMLLVIACPCALVISTPVAIVTALGNAAKNGILIKGGTFLEKAGSINAIAFDKTGTLTTGKPEVTDITVFNGSEEDMLAIVRTLEEYSTHPIAKTIVQYATSKNIAAKNGENFKNIVGKGVQATIEGVTYFAGNSKLFQEVNDALSNHLTQITNLQNEGKTIIIIGTTDQVLGVVSVSDTIRETTKTAITKLKEVGVQQMVMLTGDNEGTARTIAQQAGIGRYFSELLPEDKVTTIHQLHEEGYAVAMIGDGINDAPALATADLGIAMGGAGTDTAMDTADIVLMADNLEKLPHTIKLSRRTLNIIKQNVWFSLLIKVVALALILPGWLTLWMAVLSDTGAALIVILNSLRLLRV